MKKAASAIVGAPVISPQAAMAFGSRIRPSPFFAATLRWGASAFTVYNHTFMPAAYASPAEDYQHLVRAATLWDVAGERQVEIEGRDAFALTQMLTPRNLSACAAGRCRYVLITGDDGGVLNDPVLLRVAKNKFWLSAADADLLPWCRAAAARYDMRVKVRTPDVSPLQLQGPRAPDVAAALFGEWVREMRYFHLRQFDFEGAPLVLSRTGWSGEPGYEIYLCHGAHGDRLWERIMAAGAPFGLRPGAPSTVRRLEAGLLSYGADANCDDDPYQLGMGRLVDLNGGFDFIGKRALQKAKRRGLKRLLVGVVIHGAPLNAPLVRWWDAVDQRRGGRAIGKVRSAAYSPRLKKNIGLAMISAPHFAEGSKFFARDERGVIREARVHPLPFIPNSAASSTTAAAKTPARKAAKSKRR